MSDIDKAIKDLVAEARMKGGKRLSPAVLENAMSALDRLNSKEAAQRRVELERLIEGAEPVVRMLLLALISCE